MKLRLIPSCLCEFLHNFNQIHCQEQSWFNIEDFNTQMRKGMTHKRLYLHGSKEEKGHGLENGLKIKALKRKRQEEGDATDEGEFPIQDQDGNSDGNGKKSKRLRIKSVKSV